MSGQGPEHPARINVTELLRSAQDRELEVLANQVPLPSDSNITISTSGESPLANMSVPLRSHSLLLSDP